MPEANAAPAQARKIHASRFKLAESVRNVWTITPEEGTPYEALFDKAYWAHISARLKPCDRIEVLPEDSSYFAELVVLDAGHLFARVAELRKVDLDKAQAEPEASGALDIVWKGPHMRFAVVRLSDKAVLQSGFQQKSDAMNWAADHLKSQAA